jgi:hypothetical protein
MKDLLKQILPHNLEDNIHVWMWTIIVAVVLGISMMAHGVADTVYQSALHPPCGCLGSSSPSGPVLRGTTGMDNE